ncbi:hypothetical protein LCGC14_1652470 [marine sediment metagenome]|uniref:Uncharacterized protein n=1 Tax=marine sediment metagenome TaxID=412755 RepID=A0A0F9KC83_9ZZZZ
MKVWVTRDKGDGHEWVDIWRGRVKPILKEKKRFSGGLSLFTLFTSECKTVFGFTPRKGSCRQMELSLKEIE